MAAIWDQTSTATHFIDIASPERAVQYFIYSQKKTHSCQHTLSQEVNRGGLQPVIPPWDECKHVPPTTFPLQLYLSQVLLWTVALY